MARKTVDENGEEVIGDRPVATAAAAPEVRVYEVMVDAIGTDAIKGDLVTKDDVTWDFDFLAAQHAIRPAAEYERAYDEEGLRSTTQPKEGQPQQAPVLLQNAPQTQPAPVTPVVEPAPVVAPVVEPS